MYPYIDILGRRIGSYGLCMILGFGLVIFLSMRRGKRFGVASEDIWIVGATVVAFAMLGGGLLYVWVTFPLEVVIELIMAGNFEPLLGIVFYGGLIGGAIGAIVGAKIAKCPMGNLLPSVVPFIPLGHAIGRIGCLLGGCCYGMEYDGPLAIHYPHSLLGLPPEQGYFPVQPLEALCNVAIFAVLFTMEKRMRKRWDILWTYGVMYAVCRFTLEYFRGDAHRGIFSGVSLSQWISIGLLVICVIGLCIPPKRKTAEE